MTYEQQCRQLPQTHQAIIQSAWGMLKMAEFLGDVKGQQTAYAMLEKVLPVKE